MALYTTVFFRDHPAVESGYAMSVRPSGLSILVPRFGIEGWAHVSTSSLP